MTLTQEHVDAMWQVCRLWPYPKVCTQDQLIEIHTYLQARLNEHTLTPLEVITHASNYPKDWSEMYEAPTLEDFAD